MYWRRKTDGEWQDTKNLSVVIERIKDTTIALKVDIKEAVGLAVILGQLTGEKAVD